ncbi:MAG: hypothetical protein ACLR0U_21155 [Enterocloster clostridioformis]
MMNRRLEAGWKRITSGFLAFTIVSILILGNSGIAFAEEYDDRFYREETDLSELGEFSKATVSNASFKNSKKDDVVISILSEEGDYRPGGLVTLDVHLKNRDRNRGHRRLTDIWRKGDSGGLGGVFSFGGIRRGCV